MLRVGVGTPRHGDNIFSQDTKVDILTSQQVLSGLGLILVSRDRGELDIL
jgi:hypothetical protein